MTPRQAIEQAKAVLINDRELNRVLSATGSVRVPVLPDTPATYTPDRMPTNTPPHVVTFTIEDGHFGKCLFAEFNGYKEFAA
jgi:hypothetical protein